MFGIYRRKNINTKNTENEMQVRAAIDWFIEKWYEEGGCSCVFTKEEINRKFMNPSKAKKILVQAGCNVKVISPHTTGFLWWRKQYPEIWEIKIPVPTEKEGWGFQI